MHLHILDTYIISRQIFPEITIKNLRFGLILSNPKNGIISQLKVVRIFFLLLLIHS